MNVWMRRCVLGFGLMAILAQKGLAMNDDTWKKLAHGIYESQVSSVAVDPEDSFSIMVGSSKALYRSTNSGHDFKAVLIPRGYPRNINEVTFSESNPAHVYAATSQGLYESLDQGNSWNQIFTHSDPSSRQCLSVRVLNNTLFVGTKKGLFYRQLDETTWRRLDSRFHDVSVYQILTDATGLYVRTATDLWRFKDDLSDGRSIFSQGIQAELTEDSDDAEEGLNNYQNSSVRFALVDKDLVVVAGTAGIFISENDGDDWERIMSGSVPLDQLTSIIWIEKADDHHGHTFLIGTKRGAFLYRQGGWSRIYRGLDANYIAMLIKDASGKVYAATDRGLYSLMVESMLPSRKTSPIVSSEISNTATLNNEPSINDVHLWAVNYAEVHPDKIKHWRESASKKAILPTLSFGLDRADTEKYHWDTGASPDALLKGKDFLSWDVSLSWDLSELIWNNDQTSIDSRSKLMVELREEIIDQVTRIYFERKRLLLDLSGNPTADPALKIDQEMRIAELTALLDGYTGGKFSGVINKKLNFKEQN